MEDNKINNEFWFEYHCYESHNSTDAELWYRSHQKIVVLEIVENGGGDSYLERTENGEPRVYKIKFLEDGFIGHAFEDEILHTKEDFERPEPEKRKGIN